VEELTVYEDLGEQDKADWPCEFQEADGGSQTGDPPLDLQLPVADGGPCGQWLVHRPYE